MRLDNHKLTEKYNFPGKLGFQFLSYNKTFGNHNKYEWLGLKPERLGFTQFLEAINLV